MSHFRCFRPDESVPSWRSSWRCLTSSRCYSKPREVLKNCLPFELAAFCQDVPFWYFCYILLFFHIWSRSVINIILSAADVCFLWCSSRYILCHLPTFWQLFCLTFCRVIPVPVSMFSALLAVLLACMCCVQCDSLTQTLMAAKQYEHSTASYNSSDCIALRRFHLAC